MNRIVIEKGGLKIKTHNYGDKECFIVVDGGLILADIEPDDDKYILKYINPALWQTKKVSFNSLSEILDWIYQNYYIFNPNNSKNKNNKGDNFRRLDKK